MTTAELIPVIVQIVVLNAIWITCVVIFATDRIKARKEPAKPAPNPAAGWCVACSRIVRRWERCACGEMFAYNGRCVFDNVSVPYVSRLTAEQLAHMPDDADRPEEPA
ncbi:hypothetical protein [Occultella gossypii]|uniref:Uncharacterized protein n=1 Tax=Occultella gossypii TaxID=2800820 RepID=A0ABS7SBL3_9MICO|nr:hypothetical protein [Occultella gossypii]MBZ2197263.1 hypothetical protein [Occultella gossypii]